MSLRICLVLFQVLGLLSPLSSATVFVDPHMANSILTRSKRANSGFLEELKQGNLERECIEEICDYEEAREIFENDQLMRVFWKNYSREDPCELNPCRNNGTCFHSGTSYRCLCSEGFEGRHCQTVFEDSLKCMYQNGKCEHFCDGSGDRRRCFCAEGYKLGVDGQECVAQVQFPCGKVVPLNSGLNQSLVGQTRLVGFNLCPRGECPWQVLLELNGEPHCGGVLVQSQWVLTAAHCVFNIPQQHLNVVAGEVDLDEQDSSEQRVPILSVMVAPGYSPLSGEADLALLRLDRALILNRDVVPVCLPDLDLVQRELVLVRYHMVSGWGLRTSGGNKDYISQTAPGSPQLRRINVPIIQNPQCAAYSGLNLTDHMICAGYLQGNQDSCRGNDGSPLVTAFGSTHFLLGVLGWGRGCAKPGFYGLYTSPAHFSDWVYGTIRNQT